MTDEQGKATGRIELESMDDSIGLFGVFDENLAVFEEETGVRLRIHNDGIAIEGEPEQVAFARPFSKSCSICSARENRSTAAESGMRSILPRKATPS